MLSKEELFRILESWSFWGKTPPKSVPRNAATTCVLYPEVVNVITGVRRCGKSTLLQQLLKSNSIHPESAVFVNFEDPRLTQYLDHPLLEQIFELAEENEQRPYTFFFDEIQHVVNWQKWINSSLGRRPEHTFVVTGSNSRLLGGELATSLTGRHLSTELFPFDLDEFRKLHPRGSLRSYLKKGGFPDALKIADPERLLQQYFHDIIERDVRERVSAKSSRPLVAVAQIVFESVGSETSLRRIAGALQLSPETVSAYLQACEDAYLVFSCPYFAYSEAKRTRRNKKYYAIDTALRRAVTTKLGADLRKDFENLVYLTLRKKTTEVFYWRGKAEVDFVVNTASGVTPFQVTFGRPRKGHEKGLREFYEQFPHAAEAIYVTPGTFEELMELEL
jgi:predicted AAA+ superfamily ATPase